MAFGVRSPFFVPASWSPDFLYFPYALSSLSSTLAPKGIRANTVTACAIYFPGGVWRRREHEAPDVFKQAVAHCRMGWLGRTEEVAKAVVFLASPAASYSAGTNLIVDGAATRRVPKDGAGRVQRGIPRPDWVRQPGRTTVCRRRHTASATLPLPGAAEGQHCPLSAVIRLPSDFVQTIVLSGFSMPKRRKTFSLTPARTVI